MEEKHPDSLEKPDAGKRNTLKEEQMIKQEGPDEQTQGYERGAKKPRWTGNCPLHLNARQARMFDKALVLMGRGNHVGGSLLENVGLDAERTN